jgi:hypothetical protein
MPSSSSPGVDDTAARLIITPLVGIALPNLAGMVNHGAHSMAGLVASYAWFIGVAFVTWEANLRLYLLFQDRTAWLTRPWHRVRLLVGLICLFTIPFTSSALWLWAELFQDPNANWRSIAMAVITIVAAVTFITHVYETLFLVKEWQSDRAHGEHLQRSPHAVQQSQRAQSPRRSGPSARLRLRCRARRELSLPAQDRRNAIGAACR